MNGRVSEVFSNGILIESEASKSCLAYFMNETVFNGSRNNLINIGDTIIIEHTGQILETNLIQIYCKRIWKNKT
jgi:hypothetical protein